jgi:uncharacterized protein YjbI with pentapeptide repeats
VTNDNSKPPEQPVSWFRRIILIVVVSGVLAVLATLAWPTIEKPLGLAAADLRPFWVAIIVAATFSITCFLIYFVAKKSLWDFLDLLIVPLALAIIGLGFTAQQQARQTQIEEQRAQNAALQAYLDQMNPLILEKGLLDSKEGDTEFTLAKARTTTVLAQLDGEHNQAVTRFLFESGLLREPSLVAKATLPDAKLHKAVLQNANLAGTYLKDANLTDAVLINADFYAKVGKSTQPINADLPKADLSRAALQGANLSKCPLEEATLSYATLQSADLSSAKLQGADLSHAALQRADLSPATVPGFPHLKIPTNLTDADLTDADLTDADLTDADLTDADLTDADLTDAKGWTREQFTAARTLEGATMPDGQTLKGDRTPDGPTFEEWLKSKGSG